jgi:mRNA-degrading endonuclease RelE of RelBE toxin-antitoxin system
MRTVRILPSFEKSIKKLTVAEKGKLQKTLYQFNEFLMTGVLPAGLGYKKVGKNTFELRIDIRLRIIVNVEDNIYYLVLVGDHNEIKRVQKN